MAEQKLYVKNSAYQQIEVLKTNRNKRYRQNCFLVEGVRSLNEAVKNGWKIRSLIYVVVDSCKKACSKNQQA